MKTFRLLAKGWQYIFLLVLALTPILWFINKEGYLINGVDTNFPLNPLIWFTRRLYLWNDVLNAGANFSSSTAGIPFHLIQLIPFLLGFKLDIIEAISLVFWFSTIVGFSYFLASTIFENKVLPRIVFTIFYSFNTYIFNTWENVKVANLSLVAGIPVILGILILLDKRKISVVKAYFFATLFSILISGIGINPSYFACLLLVLIAYSFIKFLLARAGRWLIFRNFVLVVLFLLVANIFWIVPTFKYILSGVPLSGSLDKIGFTNWVDSLSEHTSILNILRLQGAWDWYTFDQATGLPLYIPYSLNYFYRVPFIVFSFLIPALAMISLFVRRCKDKWLYAFFLVMMILGIFLGVGTHEPTGTVFKFLIKHLPFFSLFRSPWYIFTPILILAYSGLIGLLFATFLDFFEKGKKRIGLYLIYLFSFILVVGNLVYCYPLITGKIFRPSRNDSFYVKFPSYVFETAKWLEKSGITKRIISYPDDEIENFKWGYRGIESILQLISDKELVFTPLNSTTSSQVLLVKRFYDALKKGQLDVVYNLVEKLNLGAIFEKKDQWSLSPPVPNELKNETKTFTDWEFHLLPGALEDKKIYSGVKFYGLKGLGKIPMSISAVGSYGDFVNSDDSVLRNINGISSFLGEVIVPDNTNLIEYEKFINTPSNLKDRLADRDLSRALFKFKITEEGLYEPILEKYGLEYFGIDPGKDLNVDLNGNRYVLRVSNSSGSYIHYQPVQLPKGEYTLSFDLKNVNLISGGDFEGENNFVKGGYGESSADYKIVTLGTNNYLSIANYGKAEASADFEVKDFDPFSPYFIKLNYYQIYGNNANVVVAQNTDSTLVKASTERLPNYPGWNSFSFYYQSVPTKSALKVFLISPYIADPLGTTILYDNLEVYRVFNNNLVLVREPKSNFSNPKVSFKKINPTLYEGTVSGVSGPHIISFLENHSSEWKMRITSAGNGSKGNESRHFSLNSYANGWYIENTLENYNFEIYYSPQKIYVVSLIISGLSVLVAFFLFIREKLFNEKY